MFVSLNELWKPFEEAEVSIDKAGIGVPAEGIEAID